MVGCWVGESVGGWAGGLCVCVLGMRVCRVSCWVCVCVVCRVSQSVSSQGVSIRLRVYGYARVCVCDGDGEQVDRELDHDDQVDRDHGVRELDALRLQDGYLLC